MMRRVGAAPGANLAYRMKVIFPALPRRAGSASLVSLTRMPKPGTRLSNTSTRWPRGAGGRAFRKRSVSSLLSAIGRVSGKIGGDTASPRQEVRPCRLFLARPLRAGVRRSEIREPDGAVRAAETTRIACGQFRRTPRRPAAR